MWNEWMNWIDWKGFYRIDKSKDCRDETINKWIRIIKRRVANMRKGWIKKRWAEGKEKDRK